MLTVEPDPLTIVHNLTFKHSSDPLWTQTQEVCQEVSDNFKPGSTEGLKYVYRLRKGGYAKVLLSLLQFILMVCVCLILLLSSLRVGHGSTEEAWCCSLLLFCALIQLVSCAGFISEMCRCIGRRRMRRNIGI